MVYLNQKGYPHIHYMHGTSTGGVPKKYRNVGTSGCGLCSACMMVDRLTAKKLPLEEAVRLSEENGCNTLPGTRMRYLGPILAEKYNLTFAKSKSSRKRQRRSSRRSWRVKRKRKIDVRKRRWIRRSPTICPRPRKRPSKKSSV